MPSHCGDWLCDPARIPQIFETAEVYQDKDLLILGHYAGVNSYYWLGELIKAQKHAEQVLALYTEERHGHLVRILNVDLKSVALG